MNRHRTTMYLLFVQIWKSRGSTADHCRTEHSRKRNALLNADSWFVLFLPEGRTATGAEPQQVVTWGLLPWQSILVETHNHRLSNYKCASMCFYIVATTSMSLLTKCGQTIKCGLKLYYVDAKTIFLNPTFDHWSFRVTNIY